MKPKSKIHVLSMASEVYLKQRNKQNPNAAWNRKAPHIFLQQEHRWGERHTSHFRAAGKVQPQDLLLCNLGQEVAQTPRTSSGGPCRSIPNLPPIAPSRGRQTQPPSPSPCPCTALGSPVTVWMPRGDAIHPACPPGKRGLSGRGPGADLLTEHDGQNAARAILTAGMSPLGKHAKTRLLF